MLQLTSPTNPEALNGLEARLWFFVVPSVALLSTIPCDLNLLLWAQDKTGTFIFKTRHIHDDHTKLIEVVSL